MNFYFKDEIISILFPQMMIHQYNTDWTGSIPWHILLRRYGDMLISSDSIRKRKYHLISIMGF